MFIHSGLHAHEQQPVAAVRVGGHGVGGILYRYPIIIVEEVPCPPSQAANSLGENRWEWFGFCIAPTSIRWKLVALPLL